MSLLSKLERKFGRFAIHNLILYMLIGFGVGYILYYINPTIYNLLPLYPELVMRGQVWRLVTWIITIPDEFSIWTIFMLYLFYWIGSSLENYWGAFRFNLYVFSGIIIMALGTMLVYFIFHVPGMTPSTYYVYMASFFAFATCFPNMQLFLMGIIPVKIKWLAILDGVLYVYNFISIGKLLIYPGTKGFVYGVRISIVLSFLNFIVFFFATRNYKRISPSEIRRKKQYKKQMVQAKGVTHKCAVCGRTPEDGEDLVFRYCSKCSGGYEYCQDHLFTHEHK